MATKLTKNNLPPGKSIQDFTYQGRLAATQGDFGAEVGRADMDAVDENGQVVPKFYHGGVVQSGDGHWWVYLEWGKHKAMNSWTGDTCNQEFQFVDCTSEQDARAFFTKQMASKNNKRLVQKSINGVDTWVSKNARSSGYAIVTSDKYGLPAGGSTAAADPAPAPAAAPAPAPAPAPTAAAAPEPEAEPTIDVVPFSPELADFVSRYTSGRPQDVKTVYKLVARTYKDGIYIELPPIPEGRGGSPPAQQTHMLLRGCELTLPDRQILLTDIQDITIKQNLQIQLASESVSVNARIARRDGSWLSSILKLYIARRRAALLTFNS